MAVGPAEPWGELNDNKIEYVAGQILDGIEWLEKTTGRTYDDELFIEACWNDFRSTSKWAEICTLNQAVPAPLEEKTMYSLYVSGHASKSPGAWLRTTMPNYMKKLRIVWIEVSRRCRMKGRVL